MLPRHRNERTSGPKSPGAGEKIGVVAVAEEMVAAVGQWN